VTAAGGGRDAHTAPARGAPQDRLAIYPTNPSGFSLRSSPVGFTAASQYMVTVLVLLVAVIIDALARRGRIAGI
jgi:hypothetical protein